jgi:TolB-like protein
MYKPHIPLSEEIVRKELSLILGFHEIRNSQILSKFIEFVVEKKLSGKEDEIKEYTIAVMGLGKSSDFNPQLDASVRIHAGRLRKILAQYYQEKGKDNPILINIPKGSYVPVFTSRNTLNGQDHVLAASAVLNTIENKPGQSEHIEAPKKPVLAVLPFHNLSPEKSKDYFVAGIGEQMSTDLARFQNISVISYFSTTSYNAELKDLQEMKEKVNIDYVLTGSVRFMNEMVKLNVQLILAENGEIVFTETHSRHLNPENIFEIQDEIVSNVLNVIADDNGIIIMNKAHASPFTRAETLSVQEAIYKFFDYTWDYNLDKFKIALGALTQAVQTEPQNALALALLAGLYMDIYITEAKEDAEMLEKSVRMAEAAVKYDPQCQHAQKALAWSYLLSNKKDKSFEAIEQCIRLNPKASSIISTMALAYICQGDFTRGFKWLLESIHLNPTSTGSTKFCFCLYYFYTGNYQESVKWLDRLNPLGTPFLMLLQLSLEGKINKTKKSNIDKYYLSIKDNIPNIINRTVYDEGLRNDILDGLKTAGLTFK